MSADEAPRSDLPAVAKRSFSDFSKILVIAGTFFILTVTLANALHSILNLTLLPLFEDTFDGFRGFFRGALNFLLYSWMQDGIEWLVFGLSWVASLISGVVPFRPDIAFPAWLADWALISVALTRMFQNTDVVVPAEIRWKARGDTTEEQQKEMRRAEGPFWAPLHNGIEMINLGYWKIVNVFEWVESILMRRPLSRKGIVRQLGVTLCGFLMWGYVRLAGYLISVLCTLQVQAPILTVRRRMLLYFCVNFVGAIAACLVFFVVNGFLNERFVVK